MYFASLAIWLYISWSFGPDMIINSQVDSFGQISFPLLGPGLVDNPETLHCMFLKPVNVKAIRLRVLCVRYRRQLHWQMLFNYQGIGISFPIYPFEFPCLRRCILLWGQNHLGQWWPKDGSPPCSVSPAVQDPKELAFKQTLAQLCRWSCGPLPTAQLPGTS